MAFRVQKNDSLLISFEFVVIGRDKHLVVNRILKQRTDIAAFAMKMNILMCCSIYFLVVVCGVLFNGRVNTWKRVAPIFSFPSAFFLEVSFQTVVPYFKTYLYIHKTVPWVLQGILLSSEYNTCVFFHNAFSCTGRF